VTLAIAIYRMILGIDPGVRKLWYALIQDDLSIVDAGVLILDTKQRLTREHYRERMSKIRKFFVQMIEDHDIGTVSVEKLFAFRNYNNIEFVYGVRSMLMTLFREEGCHLVEYTPLQLKKYICGTAKASKESVLQMITRLYSLDEEPEYHDTADALGLAYLALKKVN
jgi:crossover junction endodeoxyribonuclease RuvC